LAEVSYVDDERGGAYGGELSSESVQKWHSFLRIQKMFGWHGAEFLIYVYSKYIMKKILQTLFCICLGF